MKVLVTGACGFVGRHFTKRLCDDGHEVIAVDDMSNGQRLIEWAFQPKTAPVFFSYDCRRFFNHYDSVYFDLIIHCAAVIGSRAVRDNGPLAIAENLAIDTALFQWAANTNANRPPKRPRIVYFSSSAAYGTQWQTRDMNVSLSERLLRFDDGATTVGIPDHVYGWAKMTGEYLAHHAVKSYGLDVVIYRPQSGYGEDQSPDYPLPRIVQRVVDREDPLVIWGSGDHSRDFIHIDDIVEAVLRSALRLADEYGLVHALQAGEVLNLGSGEGTTFEDLAQMASAIGGFPYANIVFDKTKPEGTFARRADVTKMAQFYTPKVTLMDGLGRVYRHLAEKASLTKVKDTVV